ncbi:MAG: hypothetical protein Q4E03_00910 [Trueperella sp.]|nr:hypothetical protein [Trueperella sp.]
MAQLRKALLVVLAIIAALLTLFVVFLISFQFYLEYHLSEIARDNSPDNSQTVIFYEVGSAILFGPSTVRLVLEDDGVERAKQDLTINNDGKSLDAANWSPIWFEDRVRVFIYGEEQTPQYCDLQFTGQAKCLPAAADITELPKSWD